MSDFGDFVIGDAPDVGDVNDLLDFISTLASFCDTLRDVIRGRSVETQVKKEKAIIEELTILLGNCGDQMPRADFLECQRVLRTITSASQDLEQATQKFSSRWSYGNLRRARQVTKECRVGQDDIRSRTTKAVVNDRDQPQGEPTSANSLIGLPVAAQHAESPVAGLVNEPESIIPPDAEAHDIIIIISSQSIKSQRALAEFLEGVGACSRAADSVMQSILEVASHTLKESPILAVDIVARRKGDVPEDANISSRWQSYASMLVNEPEADVEASDQGILRVHVVVASCVVSHVQTADDLVSLDLKTARVVSFKPISNRSDVLEGNQAFSGHQIADMIGAAATNEASDGTGRERAERRLVRELTFEFLQSSDERN